MAFSLSNFLFLSLIALLSSFPISALCATVTYDFNITWVYANPSGLQNRAVIGINNAWPLPTITATKGDRLIVHVHNQLGNESTSLHFHGIYQNGSTHMDGAQAVSQCGIPPDGHFTYNFTIDQPGTYWYHSHTRSQYPDGLRGPLIIHDPTSPHASLYTSELVLTFSDWYHTPMPNLLSTFISIANPSGAEPVPDSSLVNETRDLDVRVEPGATYLVRLVNIGAFAAQYVWFEGHTMRVVEVDGVYTDVSDEVDMLYLTAAQRYGVLVTMRNSSEANFAFVASMDQDLFDTVPEGLNPNVTGWLVYDESRERPAPQDVDAFEPFDDAGLVPEDKEALYEAVDHSIELNLKMDNLADGANYAFFNDITYVSPKVPTLYTALSTGANATNPLIYGSNTNQILLTPNQVVEIVLNNDDPGKHPFHLHGHAFQLISRADEDSGPFNASTPPTNLPATPMRRDTVLVRPNSHLVLRFRADNPGVWLFHCHIEWHVASGLIATFVEAPLELQRQLGGRIPEDHWQACRAEGTPTAGNAAGNTRDVLDLRGENRAPGTLPAGFTARGVVALVFSCVAAAAGMGVIGWYGMAPVKG